MYWVMWIYLIFGFGALWMTQVNWVSSPGKRTAFLILFTKRGGTKRKNVIHVKIWETSNDDMIWVIRNLPLIVLGVLEVFVTYPEQWSCQEYWHCHLSLWQSTCTGPNHLLSCCPGSVCRNHQGPEWWCDEDLPPLHDHLQPIISEWCIN